MLWIHIYSKIRKMEKSYHFVLVPCGTWSNVQIVRTKIGFCNATFY